MKSFFCALVLAAVIVAMLAIVWFKFIDFLNEITGQPGRHQPERQRHDQ